MEGKSRRGMEPRDLTHVHFVSDPQLSPDGRKVAFVVTTLSEEKDEYLSNIWIVDAESGAPRRFTTGPKRDTAPRWSPDSHWLAFLSEREPKQKAQLYVMPADGGEAKRLTTLKNGVSAPTWAPDSQRLAFVSKVGGWTEPESEEEKAKSKPARTITTLKHKLNGEGFTYDRRGHVFVVGIEGSEPGQITDGDWADADPAWSPDGASLAFVSARHASRDLDNASDVWIVSAEGGEPRQVTNTTGPVQGPIFSRDGCEIVYSGHDYPDEAGRNTRVFRISVEGGAPVCLTANLDRNVHAGLHLLDHGESVAFLVDERGNVPLDRVPLRGGEPRQIVGGDRQSTDFSTSADGETIAFAATSPTAPAEVYLCRADGSDERQLTDLNAAWKDAIALSSPEHFVFERDGFAIDAWAMRPVGFVPGQKYPTLLNVHGGPMAQYGNAFFDEFQVQAGAGYAVVYANPRGSQGVSEDFTRAVVGDWGGGDYQDVMAALDAALARFDFLDPERLGVLGGSYGGFMTSWTIGHTDRFKAACSERAVNNLVSMYGTSDISPRFLELHQNGMLWDSLQAYLDHSPIAYASRVSTPVLIVHSENDLRCPIEQGEQYFVTLKRLGKEAVFVRFPDESHELSRSGKPRHRLERFRIILDWFGNYLMS